MQLCCLEFKAISHDNALLSKEASTNTNTKASLAQRSAVNDFFLTREGCFCLFSCFKLHPKNKKKKQLKFLLPIMGKLVGTAVISEFHWDWFCCFFQSLYLFETLTRASNLSRTVELRILPCRFRSLILLHPYLPQFQFLTLFSSNIGFGSRISFLYGVLRSHSTFFISLMIFLFLLTIDSNWLISSL